jgi:hypothetical protein
MSISQFSKLLGERLKDFGNADLVADSKLRLDAYQLAGSGLFHLMFSDNDSAVKAFSKWISAIVSHKRLESEKPPILFVRVVLPADEIPIVIPLQLVRAPTLTGEQVFLGQYVEVESPLEFEEYDSTGPCVQNWRFLLPQQGMDGPLNLSRKQLEPWLSRITTSRDTVAVQYDLKEFGDWISEGAITTPTVALLILSHHADDKIYFDSDLQSPAVPSSSFLRKFAPHSLAVVNACGIAAPGAFDIVHQLNKIEQIATVWS